MPVGAIADWQLDLVPQERVIGRVVEHGLLENEAIGDAHDTAVVEIAIDPLPDFHQRGAQHADIDHIALDAAQLHTIASRIEAPERHSDPAGNAGDDFLQRECDASASDTECNGEAGETIAVSAEQHQRGGQESGETDELARPVGRRAALEPPRNGALEQPRENGDDNDDERRRGQTNEPRLAQEFFQCAQVGGGVKMSESSGAGSPAMRRLWRQRTSAIHKAAHSAPTAALPNAVLGNAGRRRRGDRGPFVDVGDRDGDGLCRGVGAVRCRDVDVIDVVAAGIGRGFVVGRGLEGDRTGRGVDVEQSRIGPGDR